jgi:uncharacterized membrane protein YcaP (DUF421 family)
MRESPFFFHGWEAIVRIAVVGTLAYTALVFLLRISKKRTLVRMNAFDLIITVALGASFGRTLTASEVALVEAVTAFVLLISLQYIVSYLQIRSTTFGYTVTAPPTLLMYRGRYLRDAMRREFVTEAELRTAVREHGLGSFDQVEAIVLESDGGFSVLKTSETGQNPILDDLLEEESEQRPEGRHTSR